MEIRQRPDAGTRPGPETSPAGAANLAIADGSALLFVGLPGFFAWLVWLLATGVRLVRARTADRPDDASTSDQQE